MLPKPPISSDVDLRELFAYMPLRVQQLLESDTWILATGDEAKACVTLWCRAWHQVPAGSLPNNDRLLATLSGAGENWPNVRDIALRGFHEHSDGRLYHKRIVEKAIEAWDKRWERSVSGKKGAAKMWENKRKLKNGTAIKEPEASQSPAYGIEGKGSEGNHILESANADSCSPTGEPRAVRSAMFSEWWAVWPTRIGRAPARKAFDSAIQKATLDQLIDGVRTYISNKPVDRKWLNPKTWLNQERWKDEFTESAAAFSRTRAPASPAPKVQDDEG